MCLETSSPERDTEEPPVARNPPGGPARAAVPGWHAPCERSAVNPARAALLLLAAGLTACGTAGAYRAGYASTRIESVRVAPVSATPAATRVTVVAADVSAPVRPVYDACPICGAPTACSVDTSLDVLRYTCGACGVIVYAWPDGAAWAQRQGEDGLESWRLHGTTAEPVECVPFAAASAPAPAAVARPTRLAHDRARGGAREGYRGGRGSGSEGAVLISESVRMVGHPTSLPGHPTGRPSHPVTLPSSPVGLPSHPVTRPASPVDLPSHPVTLPSSPVDLPSHPVTRPAAPVDLPSHPVTLPASPTDLPSHPVTLPSHPVLRPGAIVPAAQARRGSPAPRSNPLDGVLFNRDRAK